jgi:hypothetical protein
MLLPELARDDAQAVRRAVQRISDKVWTDAEIDLLLKRTLQVADMEYQVWDLALAVLSTMGWSAQRLAECARLLSDANRDLIEAIEQVLSLESLRLSKLASLQQNLKAIEDTLPRLHDLGQKFRVILEQTERRPPELTPEQLAEMQVAWERGERGEEADALLERLKT